MTCPKHRHYLYSFRRCPYAMRARMALRYADIKLDIEGVDFKNKPARMLELSPKGTVPVLVLDEGTVIEESVEIMDWALSQNDPDHWLKADKTDIEELIARNDGAFKQELDRYKYPDRYPDEDCSDARALGFDFLNMLNERLSNHKQLCGDHITKADIALFPFIRQFANTDREWFDSLPLTALQNWLTAHLESDLFTFIMQKDLKSFD